MCRSRVAVLLVLAGCATGVAPEETTMGPETEPPDRPIDAGPGRPDAAPAPDAPPRPDAPPDDGAGVAPARALAGERPLADGDTPVSIGGGDAVYRVDLEAGEHGGFGLVFPTATPAVTVAVSRWDGARPVALATTTAGAGVRFLAALDPERRRTYWITVRAGAAAGATLTLERTPFADGSRCAGDCDRLLQLPLPNDPDVDGYDTDGGTVFRYQFGRRDLVMLVRYVARQRARAGRPPIFPYDLSQWDGQTPGTDVGAPRHASHQRGKDADLSLYGLDGIAPWRSYCTTQDVDGGRECVAGTRRNFDGHEDALEIGAAYESGRVTTCFLDRELIAAVIPGAEKAVSEGLIDRSLLGLFADGRHLQHWPNHDNHVHIRVSEAEYNAKVLAEEPFEAP